jgi:hypothetical protein
MTPEERHADAVEAAHEWRDAQRAVPRKGDKILIIWPGGPHNFEMEFMYLDETMPAPNGEYLWLHGVIDGYARTLYARPVEPGTYRMVGRPIAQG